MRSNTAILSLAASLTFAVLLPGAVGGPVGEELADMCFAQDPPNDTGCAVVEGFFGGLERPGLSGGDFRADDGAEIAVANFYFSPKYAVIHDGQDVVFRNTNPPGGNRHSVASDDLETSNPVLPVPGFGFGGGRSFKTAAPLQPGEEFVLHVDIAEMDPAAYVNLGGGNYLISYHCYIHGAAQMQGQILVTAA